MGVDKIKAAMEALLKAKESADMGGKLIANVCLQIAEHIPDAAKMIADGLADKPFDACYQALRKFINSPEGKYMQPTGRYWDTDDPFTQFIAGFYNVALDENKQEAMKK